MDKKKLISGIIVLLVLVLITIFSFLLIFNREEGNSVRVVIDGTEREEFSLNEDGIYSLNDGKNIMEIEKGKVRMLSADCPDQICVKEGWKNKNGECITCLPNKVVLEVLFEKGDVDLVL